MKKTTFSVDTDRYKSRGHGSRYSTVQAFTYTSDGLEDCHFTINTFDNTAIGHFPIESATITLSKRQAIKFARDILTQYAPVV